MHEEGYYASERAPKMLGVEPEEVYAMLESGQLEGEREEHQDRIDSWRLPVRAVHNRLSDAPSEQDRRRTAQDDPRVEDLPPAPPGS